MYKSFLKHWFDFLMAFFGLIAISPLFIILILFLYFANQGAGVFFTQNRPGRKGRIFRVIKFKTMTDEKDKDGILEEMPFHGSRSLISMFGMWTIFLSALI